MKNGVWIGLLLAGAHFAARGADATNAPVPTVELRGRVVCLSEEMRRRHGADVPDRHEHDYGFRTDGGLYYSLAHVPLAEALLTDTNLHSKTLLVKGRVFPQTQLLEVTGRLRSVNAGQTNELFYHCDVCSIQSSFPGLCACCRDPMHLVEEPIASKGRKW